MIWAIFIFGSLNTIGNAFALMKGVEYPATTVRGMDAIWLQQYGTLHVSLLLILNLAMAGAALYRNRQIGLVSGYGYMTLICVEAALMWRLVSYGNALPDNLKMLFYGYWISRILVCVIPIIVFHSLQSRKGELA